MNKKWHQLSLENISMQLNSNLETGLTKEEYEKKVKQYGMNKLEEKKAKSLFSKFIEQLKNFMVIILIVACIVSILLGEITDGIIILAIVFLNAILGILQESKAEKALAALREMTSPQAKVIRDGLQKVISVEEVVPGDIVNIETGDYIPADIRITESVNLKIEESSLTGESEPVEKIDTIIKEKEIPLGDKINQAFMSSVVTYGRGVGIVIATAMDTEIGKIANMLSTAKEQQTPLQIKLEELGKTLGIVALSICTFIFVIGVYQGHELFEMFMTSVSLAVAAIPEGLPAIVTIVLALGVQKMIKKNAIIRKLPAVETLGAATVICSDKTGTLTQNKMSVEQVFYNGNIYSVTSIDNQNIIAQELIAYGVLCNDTKVQIENKEITKIGDPTEVALIDLCIKTNNNPIKIKELCPRKTEIPFDSNRKLMTTVNLINDELISITKGAPDVLIKRCSKIIIDGKSRYITKQDIDIINQANTEMSNKALRVLAIGFKPLENIPEKVKSEKLENNLVFLGLTGMIDPPREEARKAVDLCKKAGIKPVMITGDHKNTAIAIAKNLGIIKEDTEAITGNELENMTEKQLMKEVKDYTVYARVSPEHKVRIVKAWQKNHHIVAMTGDGVNDAPALKTADIGAAMGITGTEVAKGAADMVLNDDNFATIVAAVKEGRQIFSNIKKSIHFLLSCNIGEIALIFFATLLGMPSPLLPIHLLWVNLVTDGLSALALGVEPAEKDIMNKKPRNPKASIFSNGLSWRIPYQGIMIGSLSLIAFLIGLQFDNQYGFYNGNPIIGETMAFMTLAFSQLVHSFNTKSTETSLFKLGIFSNKHLVGAFIISALLQYIVISNEFTIKIFKITSLTINQWQIVIALSLMPIVIVEIEKFIIKLFKK